MSFISYLIWGGVTIVVGAPIGVLCAKLASVYIKKQILKKALKVIEGKALNTIKLDGESIHVDKFQYKKNDGEIVKVKLENILGESQ